MAFTIENNRSWLKGEAPAVDGEVVFDAEGLGFEPILFNWTIQTDSTTDAAVAVWGPKGAYKTLGTIAGSTDGVVAVNQFPGDYEKHRVNGLSAGSKVYFNAVRKNLATR